jgi:nucleotide-binding universal stress UspA family protein
MKPKRSSPKKTQRKNGELVIRRILVPIDFSVYSKEALDYAVTMGKKFDSELILLYVVEPAVYPADFSFGQITLPNVEQELFDRGTTELDELMHERIGGALTARTLVRTGKPFLEILQTAEEESADMIVIASHGHTGVEHLIFGGTAEKVIRKATCTVLVVRAEP